MIKKIFTILGVFISISPAFSQMPSFVWAKKTDGYTSGDNCIPRSIGQDSIGNTYVGGAFYGTLDFDPGPGVSNATSLGIQFGTFIQKLDPLGNLIWVKTFGSAASTLNGVNFSEMDVQKNGTITATGFFDTSADFDPGAGTYLLTASSTNTSTFVLQLDNTGNLVYAKKIEGLVNSYVNPYDIVSDDFGNIYMGGSFYGTMDFDPSGSNYNLTATPGFGYQDAFILKLNNLGDFAWAQQFGSPEGDNIFGIAVTSANNIVLAGSFTQTVDFNSGAAVNNLDASTGGSFIMELDALGNYVWAKNFGTTYIQTIGISNNGNIYCAGNFYNVFDADPDAGVYSVPFSSGYDAYTLKLTSTGSFIWANPILGAGDLEIRDLAIDSAENVVFTGYYGGSNDFDPGAGTAFFPTNPSYVFNTFISSYNSAGMYRYTETFTGDQNYPHALCAINNGDVFITGELYDTADFNPASNSDYLMSAVSTNPAGYVTKLKKCNMTSSTTSQLGCTTYLSPSGKYTWTNSGTYIDTIANHQGCDSMLTINLTIVNTDLVMTLYNGAFTVGQTGATYQWFNCTTNSIIAGATSQSYIPITNGGYASIVTYNGCTDTSNCYNIIDVGLEDYLHTMVSVYPNPTTDYVNITSYHEISELSVLDISGKAILITNNIGKKNHQINIEQLANGIYLLKLKVDGQIIIKRIIKN